MNSIPRISAQLDENKIFKIINKNFSKLAPSYYKMLSNWFIRGYGAYGDIDKYIILIYLVNKDFIFFRKNGLIVEFETFFKDKTLEIEKINISDISKDLQIPKESVRRKVEELEKKGVIKKIKKKIFISMNAFSPDRVNQGIKEVSILLHEFNKLLKKENEINKTFEVEEIITSIKKNYSFCWYQFYKFLFVFTNRWRKSVGDLETFCVGMVVMLNHVERQSFRVQDLNLKQFQNSLPGIDDRGVNAMSISEITGIPRPTVVRKLKHLINNGFLSIDEKKLLEVNIRGEALKISKNLQDKNILSISNFTYRVFNQIKIIDSNKDKGDDFIPGYLR
ncbi:MarR family transcriptional regulator [Candidatus Pelagibacter sp.]|nr:MarR family transcriptional regulator [Candidatus Pelagibacter sp.]